MEKTGIKLIDTFVYSGKEFLDKRVFCENISELKATDATSIPEGFMRYVKSEQKWYKYDSNSVSNRNTGYWHGIDGFDTMDDSEFVYAIVDNKGNLVWGIKKDGSVYQQGAELNGPIKATGAINAGGGITANGDLVANGSATFSGPIVGEESLTLSDTKISEIYNDEFIYAIVDYTGHVLFGIKQDGTIFIPRGMSDDAAARFAELASIEVNNSEEFPFAIVDMLDSILFGIRNNGEVYIPKGQPEETKARFEELKLIQVNDSTEFPFAIIDASNNVVFAIKYTGEVYIPKGLPEEVRVRFEELKPIKQNLSEEYPFAIVDPTDLMVFGVNKEGEMYAAKGQPEETKARFKELDSIKPNESESMPFAIVTKKGGVALGVTNKGEVYIGKGQPEETKARLAELEPIHTLDAESEYNYTIVDTNDNLLFGIKKTGEVVIPGGVEDGSLEGASGFQVMHNEQYVFAITDSKDKVLFGIDKKGHSFVNGIDGVAAIEQFDSKDFVYAIMDSNDNLLFGIKKDGKTYIKALDYDPNSVISYIQPLEDHEFVYTILDNNGKILFGIWQDGNIYMPNEIEGETKARFQKIENKLSDFEQVMADFHGGTGDWSDAKYIDLPIPRLAHINLITTRMPTAKSGMGIKNVTCDIECWLEYFDHEGNYFKKKVLLSAQGNSSMAFIKKNLAIDIFNDIEKDDTFVIKFGDWVGQDSFHIKAYYTDTFRGRGTVSYMLYEQMVNTRPVNDRRPYQQTFVDKTSTGNEGYNCNTKLKENFETGAKCFPMGFPCIIYQNGEFYGVYAFQLKKHRDNMWQNKKTAENVHLDGTLGAASIFGGTIDWTQFEVRNPKSLYYQATNIEDFPVSVQNAIKQGRVTYDESKGMYEYNGDYPAEIAKKKYNCKQYIEALSKYCGELSALETDLKAQVSAGTITQDSMNTTMREEIANRFYVSFMIDYILEVNLVRDSDGWNKNWQWTTWDGVHWTANPYDHDGVFGGFHIGVYQGGAYSGSQGTSKTIPSGWIWAYYLDELKTRWAELRKAKVFDATNIAGLLKDWVDRVGYDNWEREFQRWPETPCNRDSHVNTAYWKRSGGYFSSGSDKGTWKSDTAYNKNEYVSTYEAIDVEKPDGTTKKVNKRAIWQALIANTGVDPLTDNGTTWKRISWDPNKTYAKNETCYYGCSILYQMKSQVDNNLGNEPITKFYSEYPYELGCYDNIYRVYAWLKKTIEYVDKTFDYTASSSADTVSIINNNQINDVVNNG